MATTACVTTAVVTAAEAAVVVTDNADVVGICCGKALYCAVQHV